MNSGMQNYLTGSACGTRASDRSSLWRRIDGASLQGDSSRARLSVRCAIAASTSYSSVRGCDYGAHRPPVGRTVARERETQAPCLSGRKATRGTRTSDAHVACSVVDCQHILVNAHAAASKKVVKAPSTCNAGGAHGCGTAHPGTCRSRRRPMAIRRRPLAAGRNRAASRSASCSLDPVRTRPVDATRWKPRGRDRHC